MSYGRKVAHNRRGAPKPWFNPGRVNGHCSSSPRQHPSHNLRDQPRVMLPRRALQRVRPLEAVRPRDRHLPAVARFGADDRHHPFSQPVRGYVLDERRDLPLRRIVTRVVHLHRHRHIAQDISPRDPQQTAPSQRLSCGETCCGVCLGLWRRSFSSADAATPTGGVPFRPLGP
jgi:hypothetical protein